MYNIAPLDVPVVLLFVVLALTFAFLGAFAALVSRPLRRIYISEQAVIVIVAAAILMNLVSAVLLGDEARYVSGGLTGIAGVVYGTSRALSFATMVIFIRMMNAGHQIGARFWLWGFVVSFIATIDGLASALTLAMFILLTVGRIDIRHPKRIVAAGVFGAALFWIGFSSKFAAVPDYLTADFLFRWIVSRFSIQAEQMYTFLSGSSVIGGHVSYGELVLRAISNRIDLVWGEPLVLEYPRSVSEAMYYDMWGSFYAGSTPGALLGTALQGPFFFAVVPFVYAFILVQLFYGGRRRLTLIELCAYSYLLKPVHTDFSEYLTVVSPTLLMVTFVFFSSLLVVRSRPRTLIKA